MGIYDREYIRGESSGSSLFSTSPVTKYIIGANVVVFFLQNLLHWGGRIPELGFGAQWLMASPLHTFHHFRLHELLTASFYNLDPISLLFHMWFFWYIGRDMEAIYGSLDFLIFYLASAVVTTLVGVTIAAAAPSGEPAFIFGAWGVILSVMTLFTLYYPKREILFAFIIPMPMWVLLCIYIALPMLFHFSGSGSPGAGMGMALAGAGFAYAYKQLDLRWSRLVSGRMFRPRLRIFSSVNYEPGRSRGSGPSRPSTIVGGGRAPSISVLPEEQLDARVDEILAKIARDGNKEGLSDEEQRILQEASRRARIRRSDRI
jgi:membrane associated rhomboid family serine protease